MIYLLETFKIDGLVLIGSYILVAVVFYLFGRFVFWFKSGAGVVTKTMFQRSKTVRLQDFKSGDIYKAMASSLWRRGSVFVDTKEPEKVKAKLAGLLKLSVDELTVAKLEGDSCKIVMKNRVNRNETSK